MVEQNEQSGNIGDGDKPKELSPIERANEVIKRMDETEKRIDEKLKKLEEAEASRLLSGTAGGRVEPQPPKPETDAEVLARLRKTAHGIK